MKHKIALNFLFLILISCFSFIACNNQKEEIAEAIIDRSSLPKLHAEDVTTVVSDSGITRYRISAPVWNIYDKAVEPYWEFPDGIHLEKFDLNLVVDANVHSKYAKFYENEQKWELRKEVKATNLEGSLFETEQLFWSQRDERIYSDSLIKITEKKRIIIGVGFESNQSMTKYSIRNVNGIFPVDEEEQEDDEIESNTEEPVDNTSNEVSSKLIE